MELPSEKMIKAGEDIADYMMDFSIQKDMGTLGKLSALDLKEIPEKYREITEMYLADEIASVTGIYLAMNQEKV